MRRAWHGVLVALVAATACERAQVVQSFPESFVGVGLELRIDDDTPVVIRALPGGPAELAGLQPGDRVTTIDGKSTEGASLGDVVMRLRGQPDSQVTLGVRRGGDKLMVVVRRRPMSKAASDYHPVAPN